jgi:hypothetical protein
MSKEITILDTETKAVQLGILEKTGRRYHHIRMIDGALVGHTFPSINTTRVPIDAVEVIEGFRYDLLTEYVEHNKAALLWQAQRQQAIAQIKFEANTKMVKAVETATRWWERKNPMEVQPNFSQSEEPLPTPEEPVVELETVEELDDQGGGDIQDDTFMVGGAEWSVGAVVVVRDTFESGLISKIEQVDGTDDEYNVWVAIGAATGVKGAFPVKFSADKLEGPRPGEA